MEHRSENYAAVKDARSMSSIKECALSMGHRSSTKNAAVTDVQTNLRKEECASDMGQRSNDAAAKAAHAKPCVWECASSMEHVAMHKTTLLHLDQNLKLLLQLKPYAIIEPPELLSEDKKEVAFLKR